MSRPGPGRNSALPAEAAKADPSLRIGKYIPTIKLGSGASGEVWKAWDTVLNRWVALKVFPLEDCEEAARFTREAETAATLSHPNIAATYEAGEDKGRHFLAMQFVDGMTLQKYPKGNRKLLVRIVRDAARAVRAAHDQGIVHRDLKPANIVVARRNEDPSQPHVYVLDFGLARRVEGADKLTASGIVVGTPAYMSPEQARGELVDGRADVYALGATLYELLTKRPPFRGPNLYEVLRKVQEAYPRSPRFYDPTIPRDLEMVVLKALEKNPNQRYSSAAQMADDLDRFLEGEPVEARPVNLYYRLRLKLAKRKAVVAAAIASLALASTLGWWIFIGSADARHHRYMAVGNRLWGEARLSAYTGGDPSETRKKAQAAREAYELAIGARDETGAHVMRGRCLQLEKQEEPALKALERAHELDPWNADAKVELANALFSKYLACRGTPSSFNVNREWASTDLLLFQGLPKETGEQRRWREWGEKLLAEGGIPPSRKSLLGGLLAAVKGNYSQAAEMLAEYTKAEGWDWYALTMEGVCCYLARDFQGAIKALDRTLRRVPSARGYCWRGTAKAALGLLDDAIGDYSKAIEQEPGNGDAYVKRGNAKAAQGLHKEAIEDYDKAIARDPKLAEDAYVNRARSKSAQGFHDDAIADCDRAIALNPKASWAYFNRGNSKGAKGLREEAISDYSTAIALNPAPAFYINRGFKRAALGLAKEAIEDYTTAILLAPSLSDPHMNRGIVKRALGLHNEADEDFEKAVRLDPNYAPVYLNRGASRFDRGLFNEAIKDYDQAILCNSNFYPAYANRGAAKFALGLCGEAMLDYEIAIKLNPKYAPAYAYRGVARAANGLFDEAVTDSEKAIELDPVDAEGYFSLGVTKDAKKLHDDAIAAYTAAIKLDPRHQKSYLNRGGLKCDIKGRYDEAIEDFNQAILLNPNDPAGYYNRGIANNKKGCYDQAILDFTKVIEKPGEAGPSRALAFCNRGIARAGKGKHDEAILDYDQAVSLNPKCALAYFNRGMANAFKGLHDEAILDYSKSIDLEPDAKAYHNRGYSKAARHLHKQAIDDYTKAIARDRTFAMSYTNRGVSRIRVGLYDEAISDFTAAIQLDATVPENYSNRGIAKASIGLLDEAVVDYKRALEVAPAGWPLRAEVQENLRNPGARQLYVQAMELLELEKFREAIEKLTVIVRTLPRAQVAKDSAYNIAGTYALLGEKSNSLDWLEKAIQLGFKDISYMEDDSNLESLRGEERYKRLVAKLEQK